MTFSALTYAIDGGNQTGQLWRLMLEAATLETPGGIVGPLDCIVSQTTVPSAGITVADGKVIISGQETPDQGAYYGYNAGLDTSLSISPTTGTPRSDMIVVRAEDPTYSGSPWAGPVSSQTIFPRVISSVSSTATQPPAGQSCIPLARIDMPASAGSVLQSYITDLRAVANSKRDRRILTASGPGTASPWTVGTSPAAWPAPAAWQLSVPPWATWIKMSWHMAGTRFAGGGNGTARGSVYPVFGAAVGAPGVIFPATLVSVANGGGAAEIDVMSIAGAADMSIPAPVRGTTQTLQFAQVTDGTNTGLVQVTEGTLIIADVEFHQRAVLA